MSAIKQKFEGFQPSKLTTAVHKEEGMNDLKDQIKEANFYEKNNQIDFKSLSEKERFEGNEYIKTKDWDKALEHCSKALEQYPNCTLSMGNKGFALMQHKK